MAVTEKYFPVVLFLVHFKYVLTFQCVGEILKTDHSNESYRAVRQWNLDLTKCQGTGEIGSLYRGSFPSITPLLSWKISFVMLRFVQSHSRPQSPRSFWSAPRIETSGRGSGRDRSRKSANHGLPAFVRSLRNLNNNGYYRLQKWAAIALARYLAPARGLDPWRRPKGSWALGTRMVHRFNRGSIVLSCGAFYCAVHGGSNF